MDEPSGLPARCAGHVVTPTEGLADETDRPPGVPCWAELDVGDPDAARPSTPRCSAGPTPTGGGADHQARRPARRPARSPRSARPVPRRRRSGPSTSRSTTSTPPPSSSRSWAGGAPRPRGRPRRRAPARRARRGRRPWSGSGSPTTRSRRRRPDGCAGPRRPRRSRAPRAPSTASCSGGASSTGATSRPPARPAPAAGRSPGLGLAGDALPHWLPFFAAADVDAAVEAARGAGGEVVTPVAPGPRGRHATLADPAGARFGVIEVG